MLNTARPPFSCSRELSTSHEALGHCCAARVSHIPAHNMLSPMDLCTVSGFLQLLLFIVKAPPPHPTPPNTQHDACSFELHKLHLFSAVSILFFSLAPLCVFVGWRVVNAVGGFKIEFLRYPPLLCCFYTPLFFPLVLSLAFPPLFPDDTHPTMRSISHLGTG